MLRALFVGIDRYSAPVNRLSCASADAIALASLFTDSMQGDVRTLLDETATLAGIRAELQSLQSAAADDLIVIGFSGHGTDTHELVPVDVDVNDVTGTTMALTELASLIDQIPSKNVIVFLDCCFSGGFGASRLFAQSTTRSMNEDRTSLVALAQGEGRVVITASSAGEEALETKAFGHGLLTFHLLEALQGLNGIADGNRVSLTRLYEYIAKSVASSAQSMRMTQTPTFYGSLEGFPSIEPLKQGAAYAAAFPSSVRPPATDQWTSLEPYGFTPETISAWSSAMPGINELQLAAINEHGVLDGKSVMVSAPTGAGKTMIGELAAVKAVTDNSRAVMLLPLKALVNDKYDYMRQMYSDRIKTIRATGDHSDQVSDLLGGHYDIALLTYEKFLNLAIVSPHVLRKLSVIVVDEVQTISDPNRGPALEFLLTLLRSGHSRGLPPQIVALSAVIGDTAGLERWLGGSLLQSDVRPVPLREGVVDTYGTLEVLEPGGTTTTIDSYVQPEYGSGSMSSKPFVIPLVRKLTAEGKKVIVFRAVKGDTIGAAKYLSLALGLPPATDVLDSLPADDQSSASADLRSVLQYGVGFHNADLDQQERAALEQSFRDPKSPLRVLTATTTLAMGINTPAECVVVAGLTHPFGNAYSVAEYKNMVGRAGRPGFADSGESFIIANGDPTAATAWSQYVNGAVENVQSHFLSAATDPQTLILRSLVALSASVPEDELIDLLENSFALWSEREQGIVSGWNRNRLQYDLDQLIAGQLIDHEPNGNLTLTDLGRYAGESGIEVRSVTQVASALRNSGPILGESDIITLAQVTCELDDTYLPCHKKSTKEQQRWVGYLNGQRVQQGIVRTLHVGGGITVVRAKRAAAVMMYLSDAPLTAIEQALMQHMTGNSIAGPIRQVAGRTRDVVMAVTQIALFYGKQLDDNYSSDDLAVRLEVGAPATMVEVCREFGASLTRGQYIRLSQLGLTTLDAIRSVVDKDLKERVGSELADTLIGQLTKAA